MPALMRDSLGRCDSAITRSTSSAMSSSANFSTRRCDIGAPRERRVVGPCRAPRAASHDVGRGVRGASPRRRPADRDRAPEQQVARRGVTERTRHRPPRGLRSRDQRAVVDGAPERVHRDPRRAQFVSSHPVSAGAGPACDRDERRDPASKSQSPWARAVTTASAPRSSSRTMRRCATRCPSCSRTRASR